VAKAIEFPRARFVILVLVGQRRYWLLVVRIGPAWRGQDLNSHCVIRTAVAFARNVGRDLDNGLTLS